MSVRSGTRILVLGFGIDLGHMTADRNQASDPGLTLTWVAGTYFSHGKLASRKKGNDFVPTAIGTSGSAKARERDDDSVALYPA